MENLQLKTYIIKDKNYKITDLSDIDTSYFIELDEYEKIDPNKIDEDYINGLIEISINGNKITDFTYYDDIYDLWSYYITAFDELLEKNKSSFSYPDMPLIVTLYLQGNRIVFKIGDKEFNVEAKPFLNQMSNEAKRFFHTLINLFPDLKFEYEEEIDRINSVSKKIDAIL